MVSGRLKYLTLFSFVAAIVVLLIGGYFTTKRVAPYPERFVVASENTLVADGESVRRGQRIFQKYGLMDHGSVWGQGSLRGMDFSALLLFSWRALVKPEAWREGWIKVSF